MVIAFADIKLIIDALGFDRMYCHIAAFIRDFWLDSNDEIYLGQLDIIRIKYRL